MPSIQAHSTGTRTRFERFPRVAASSGGGISWKQTDELEISGIWPKLTRGSPQAKHYSSATRHLIPVLITRGAVRRYLLFQTEEYGKHISGRYQGFYLPHK